MPKYTKQKTPKHVTVNNGVLGIARVSTEDQNLNTQESRLVAAGIDISSIFVS